MNISPAYSSRPLAGPAVALSASRGSAREHSGRQITELRNLDPAAERSRQTP
jgi:hypothetical protein